MGTCEYEFAKDCSSNKLFTVLASNQKCGLWVSCTAAVKVYIAGYYIQFTRARQTAIVNGVRFTKFPVIRPGKFFKVVSNKDIHFRGRMEYLATGIFND
jgi:hypothetical protein